MWADESSPSLCFVFLYHEGFKCQSGSKQAQVKGRSNHDPVVCGVLCTLSSCSLVSLMSYMSIYMYMVAGKVLETTTYIFLYMHTVILRVCATHHNHTHNTAHQHTQPNTPIKHQQHTHTPTHCTYPHNAHKYTLTLHTTHTAPRVRANMSGPERWDTLRGGSQNFFGWRQQLPSDMRQTEALCGCTS